MLLLNVEQYPKTRQSSQKFDLQLRQKVVKIKLVYAMKAYGGSRNKAPLIPKLGARRR